MRRLSLLSLFCALFLVAGCDFIHLPNPGDPPEEPAFPDVIPLPDGFQPEGIAIGRGTDFYVGSLATGAIYRGDVGTGEGTIFAAPPDSGIAVGLDVDERTNLLFVAGGPSGLAYVYDAHTGDGVATFSLAGPGSFVNDVIVTREAAFFTDSFRPVLYRLPLGRGGAVSPGATPEELPLGGDFDFEPGTFNANGIAATPNGKKLIIVQTARARLYVVDARTGVADAVEGVEVPNGDGLLLDGRTLYVVQNRLNQIAAVRLDVRNATGEITGTITSDAFRVPTTVAEFGDALYAVNARFGTPPTPATDYEVVRVAK